MVIRILCIAVPVLVCILWLRLAGIAFVSSARLPRNRTARMRMRLHLRLHPGKGHANVRELWWDWSKTAAYRASKRARPDLTRWQRIRRPRLHSVMVGRAQWRHSLRILAELHVLIMSPPRKGKTAALARWILRYPGPVVSTTVKADIFRYTSGIRAKSGPVDTFNPQGIGGVASTFAINPVYGCENKHIAMRRATALVGGTKTGGMSKEDGDWFKTKSAQMLGGLLYAAALLKADLRLIALWVYTDAVQAQEKLAQEGEGKTAQLLEELHNSPAEKTSATFRMILTQILGFLDDPELAKCVLPHDGLGFDIASFIRSDGTLYMIADSDQDTSPVAPLFAMILDEIKHTATQLGQLNPGGRLVKPLGYFLDEVTQIAPVPLDKWMASAGGLGMQIFVVVHGEAQLRSRWGDNGAQIIWDTADVKLFLPGITDDKTLERVSKLTDTIAFQQKNQEHFTEHPVMSVGMIRRLPRSFGLILRGEMSIVIARTPKVWYAPEYLLAKFRGQTIAHVTPAAAYSRPDEGAITLSVPMGLITDEIADELDRADHEREPVSFASGPEASHNGHGTWGGSAK